MKSNIDRTSKEIRNDLSKIQGVENIEIYYLVNNYGATFTKNGVKFDLRRWANCYGVDLGWGVDIIQGHRGIGCASYKRCIKFISEWTEGEA